MASHEEIQRQLVFAREMFVQRRVCEAAFFGNVTDAGGSQSVLAEKLDCRAENLAFSPRIIFTNIKRRRTCHITGLAVANHICKRDHLAGNSETTGPKDENERSRSSQKSPAVTSRSQVDK
jgi:hypothetical protein